MSINKVIYLRLRGLLVIVICIFIALVARLAYLQVYQHDYYMFRAEKNRYAKLPIPAPRGKIVDRNGNLVVTNKPGYGVYLVDMDKGYDEQTIGLLAELLEMDEEQIEEEIYKNRYTRYLPIHLKSDISYEAVAKIAENSWKLQGVNIEVQPIRFYPYRGLGAHFLGYLSKASIDEHLAEKWKDEGYDYREGDLVGQDALEKAWEPYLRGQDGEQLVETNSLGQPIEFLDRRDPVPGYDLHLTLDMGLQQAAMDALETRINALRQKGNRYTQRGSVVAIDPRDGAILAMVSYPSYDPNTVREEYGELVDDPRRPLINYAIKGTYPVGSTYKMVTAAAAMETGKINDRTVYHCGGKLSAVGDTKACHSVHGNISFYRALAASCNIYFYRAGLAAGIDSLAYYSRELGLGKYTGLTDISGEVEGVVASREYKLANFGERWYEAETMSAAIGQTYHSFTPLQLAVYTSILANGGTHYRPYMVDRVVDGDGEVILQSRPEIVHKADISAETFKIIQKGMYQVTQPGGTAYYPLRGLPVTVAAKTGSAQVSSDRNIPAHSIFVCYAPCENPVIALAVVVEYGEYGALSGTPVAQEIFEYYFRDLREGVEDPA